MEISETEIVEEISEVETEEIESDGIIEEVVEDETIENIDESEALNNSEMLMYGKVQSIEDGLLANTTSGLCFLETEGDF